MISHRKVHLSIGLLFFCSVFLMGQDSWDDPADVHPSFVPYSDGPVCEEDTSACPDRPLALASDKYVNPAARMVPVINFLLLPAEDAAPPQCVVDEDCDDGNPCTDDACDPVLGCLHVNNSAPCDDGSVCTTVDICSDGACLGGPPWLDCDDGNPCTQDYCDAVLGCRHVNNSAPCDDGSVCTTVDICSDGACLGGPPWLDCDDGNACTQDYCDAVTGCNHLCKATGQEDPCCEDPLCASSPSCQFPGGGYVTRVTGLTQQPVGCFLDFILREVLMALISGIEVPIYLPPESAYPAALTLAMPFIGNLDVTARFENDEISFDEVDLEPIHLADFALYLPPEFLWLVDVMQCVIDAKAIGWTQGLDADGFLLTLRLYDLVVTQEYPGAGCILFGRPVNPSCQMDFAVTGTAGN